MAKKRKTDVENSKPDSTKSRRQKKSTPETKPVTEKKNSSASEPKPRTKVKKQQTDNGDDEGLLTSQQEINATLDMVIRNVQFDEESECLPPEDDLDDEVDEEPDEECDNESDDSNESDESDDGGKRDNVRPCPPGKKTPVPIPQGGLNLFLTCVDVFVFEIDDDVLEKLILCAIISMSLDAFLNKFKKTFFPRKSSAFRPLEKQLDEKISTIYNQTLLQVMTGIQQASNKKEYVKQIFQTNLLNDSKYQNFLDLLTNNIQNLINPSANSAEAEEFHHRFEQTIRNSALGFLYHTFSIKLAEFQNAVGIKVACIETDLTFLSTEILRFTSAEAGILQLSNALALVVSARFAEDDEFDEIFDAVEEVADVIEDLAEIYRDRLKVLRTLLPFSLCPRPLVIPKIPEDDIIIE